MQTQKGCALRLKVALVALAPTRHASRVTTQTRWKASHPRPAATWRHPGCPSTRRPPSQVESARVTFESPTRRWRCFVTPAGVRLGRLFASTGSQVQDWPPRTASDATRRDAMDDDTKDGGQAETGPASHKQTRTHTHTHTHMHAHTQCTHGHMHTQQNTTPQREGGSEKPQRHNATPTPARNTTHATLANIGGRPAQLHLHEGRGDHPAMCA